MCRMHGPLSGVLRFSRLREMSDACSFRPMRVACGFSTWGRRRTCLRRPASLIGAKSVVRLSAAIPSRSDARRRASRRSLRTAAEEMRNGSEARGDKCGCDIAQRERAAGTGVSAQNLAQFGNGDALAGGITGPI